MSEKARLLLVERDSGLAEAFLAAFEATGAVVEVAPDPVQARRLSGERRYDAVVLDAIAPEALSAEDKELVAALRLGSPDTRVVLLVASAPSGLRSVDALGADLVLVKPQTLPGLAAAVERLLARPRPARAAASLPSAG